MHLVAELRIWLFTVLSYILPTSKRSPSHIGQGAVIEPGLLSQTHAASTAQSFVALLLLLLAHKCMATNKCSRIWIRHGKIGFKVSDKHPPRSAIFTRSVQGDIFHALNLTIRIRLHKYFAKKIGKTED